MRHAGQKSIHPVSIVVAPCGDVSPGRNVIRSRQGGAGLSVKNSQEFRAVENAAIAAAGLALPRRLSHLLQIQRSPERDISTIESPCILVCAIDERTGYCFGCGRTRREIEAWVDMTPEMRRHVMTTLPARLETVERRPRRETRRARTARERGTP